MLGDAPVEIGSGRGFETPVSGGGRRVGTEELRWRSFEGTKRTCFKTAVDASSRVEEEGVAISEQRTRFVGLL